MKKATVKKPFAAAGGAIYNPGKEITVSDNDAAAWEKAGFIEVTAEPKKPVKKKGGK